MNKNFRMDICVSTIAFCIIGLSIYMWYCFKLDGVNIISHKGIPVYANPLMLIFVGCMLLVVVLLDHVNFFERYIDAKN